MFHTVVSAVNESILKSLFPSYILKLLENIYVLITDWNKPEIVTLTTSKSFLKKYSTIKLKNK